MGNELDAILAQINKDYGEGTIMQASKAKTLLVDRVPTGTLSLDLALGGGIPRGRMTMFKGEYSAGKTANAMKAAVQFQHHCRYCGTAMGQYAVGSGWQDKSCACGKLEPMRVVWLDAEHSFDSDWARRWGIDTELLYVIQTEYMEQGIDVSDKCIRSGGCDLLVVDSVAAMTPSVEVEESAEKWQMGVAARLMNKAMRKWTSGMNSGGLMSQTKTTVILINQMRIQLGGYHPVPTSPGGKGLDFFQSVEVRLKKSEWKEEEGTKRPIGLETEFVVVKNKTAPPMRTGRYMMYFVDRPEEGYKVGDTDNDIQIVRAAAFWDLIKKGGAWFTWEDKKYQGEPAIAAALRKDPVTLLRLEQLVRDRELAWIRTGSGTGSSVASVANTADFDLETGEVHDNG